MEPPFVSPPAKRPYHNLSTMQDIPTNNTIYAPAYSINGATKRRSRAPPQPLIVPAGHTALRLLCRASNIGGVIGKSGSILNLVRQETGAKIRVEDADDSCDERVILVIAPASPKKMMVLKGLSDDETESGEVLEVSPAQEAVLKIFERVLELEAESEEIFPPPGGVVYCRLLADNSQVGAVMGKGGKVIEKIRKDSGTRIRVLGAEQVPACASPNDEVIQITGDVIAVKRAIVAISCCLQDNPASDKVTIPHMGGSKPAGPASYGPIPDLHREIPHRSTFVPSIPGSSIDYASRGHSMTVEVDKTYTLDSKKIQQEIAFRLLCSNENVGGVIGKGGTIVKALQNETGASISVAATVAESDERVITISVSENPESRYSQAQLAVVRVFTRAIEASKEKGSEPGSKKSAVSARLLVQASEVGCLIGKGGSIVSEMRKVTGTGIHIIVGDQVPKCASEGDEVVQITGELKNVQEALFHVTGRLRDNVFSNRTPEAIPYKRVVEPTSPIMYQPVSLSRNLDRQATLAQSMDHLGISHNTDRPPSPKLWTSQTLGGGNPRSMSDTGRGLTNLRAGAEYGSGGKSAAIVTNTTVEIVVPEDLIGSVYGETGSNLNRLRQISGAQVVMHDPRPGTRESVVIISGTPDQTQAAQSLLQAFILSGQSSSPDHRPRFLR
ncbi:hypothetical protein Sjap_022343 [Stephania japonica]|uniref:K Homology domain-containing protein n=1 Tax=Stephania japonica TaxID=461633 RepID=A0AAP0ENR0_9MAGN